MTTKVYLTALSIGGALLATTATGAPESGNSGASAVKIEIEVADDLLTLEVHDAPLSDVLHAIGDRVGFETILMGELSTPVTMSFAGIPAEEVVNRLVGDLDRTIVYGSSDGGSSKRAILRLSLFGPRGTVREHVVGAGAPATLDDLKHGDERTRAQAALRLATSGTTEEVLEALAQALQEDEDAWVRSRAAAALGSLRDERAVPALEIALADENSSVSTQAIQALGAIGGERAATALGEVLLESDDRKQRVQAAWALGRHDTELAQSFLDAVADDPDELVRMASETPPGTPRSVAGAASDADHRGSERIR